MSKLDVSDQEIRDAYDDVRNDDTPTTWLSLEYTAPKSDKLRVAATGSGTDPLSEFVEQLKENQAGFGYIRMPMSNDALSQRTKFLLVSWCGASVGPMQRAKMGVHLAEVKTVLKVYAVEIQASDTDDLSAETVTLKLRKAMGANYDRQGTDY